MKMQKFSAASPKCDTLVWIKEYLVWAAPPNPHIAAIYIAKIYKVFSTKCDTLVWMKEYPVWAAPRSWVRCRRASQGHYYYGRPKNFSSRAGNLTQSLTNTEG